jgi:hypothetical protein
MPVDGSPAESSIDASAASRGLQAALRIVEHDDRTSVRSSVMGNTIPDAAAFMSAAHHRSLHRKKPSAKTSARSKLIRIVIVTVLATALIGGVNAFMLHLLG